MEERKIPYDTISYGKIRSSGRGLPDKLVGVLDCSKSFGWHECNDKYFVHRELRAEYTDDYLLIFTKDGEGTSVLNGVEYRLRRNSVMIFPKNTPHSYFTPKGCVWEFYWMHVCGPNCDAMIPHIISEYGNCFEVESCEVLANYIELLLRKEYRYYEFELFAAQIISKVLFSLMDGSNIRQKDLQHRKMLAFRVIEYVEKHYQEPLKLSDISSQLYLSSEHVIRIFHEETGMTPYQYLKQFRLRRACQYLEDRERSISDVAVCVGYQSVSSFIAQFKSYYGITPGMYRKFCVSNVPAENGRE